jgi:hypothetical protein
MYNSIKLLGGLVKSQQNLETHLNKLKLEYKQLLKVVYKL